MALSYKLKNKAFSLLELIITVAILSIGIIVILQALSYSVRVTGLSFDIIKAVFLTEDKLQELEFKEKQDLIVPAGAEGKDGKFEWSYIIDLGPDLRLYRLDFAIAWLRANREEKFSLNTYLRR